MPHPAVLRSAVEAAVMAPSSHNSQPWRFRIHGTTLEIHADPERHLRVIDGERRQQVVSCGCALYNARVAVRAMGFTDEVTVMPEGGEQPDLLATLQLGAHRISTDHDLALMDAIPRRRTNRRAFLPRPVSSKIADRLIAAAVGEGATMVRLVPEEKRAIGHLIDEADRLQYGDAAFRTEISHWLAAAGSRRRDGIPFVEKEYGSAIPFTVMRALRSPDLGGEFGKLEEELVAGAPVVAVLGSAGDERRDWFACGQALQAVLLDATTLGLSAAFLNQVLEIPALRGRVAELLPGIGAPQMVLRLGVPEDDVRHPAPRRNVDDVLEIL